VAKRKFAYDRDAEEPWIPRKHRPSRKEKAVDEEEALAVLELLLAVRPADRRHLPLDDELKEALSILDGIGPRHRSARKRQTDRIRGMLRVRDLEELQEVMGGHVARVKELEEALDALVRWRSRLVEEGDPALQAFVEAHPAADRQHLRSLVARLRKAEPGTDAHRRANKAVMAAVREAAGI
jgi:ribosome-associated protein